LNPSFQIEILDMAEYKHVLCIVDIQRPGDSISAGTQMSVIELCRK